MERRYEDLTGPAQRRVVWYLVRRHLGFSIEDWERLPWFQQRAYLEGLKQEFYREEDEETGDEQDLTEDWSGLTRLGATVQQVPA